MWQCGESFNHTIAKEKPSNHHLVTEGLYKYVAFYCDYLLVNSLKNYSLFYILEYCDILLILVGFIGQLECYYFFVIQFVFLAILIFLGIFFKNELLMKNIYYFDFIINNIWII